MQPAIEFVDVDGRLSFHAPRLGVTAVCGRERDWVFRMVVGLTVPRDGAVIVLGQDMSRARARARRKQQRRLAVVLRGPDRGLFGDETVWDNVAIAVRAAGRIGRRTSEAEVVATALGQLDLAGMADRRPDTLARGDRTRLAVARALALRSPLLVVQDFDGDADPLLLAELGRVIRAERRAARGAALLFVRDAEAAAGIADSVIGLDELLLPLDGVAIEA